MSVWDGHSKQITKNCEGCKYHETLKQRRHYHNNTKYVPTGTEVCNWGVAWKVLVETDKPRKCTLINPKDAKSRSLDGKLS